MKQRETKPTWRQGERWERSARFVVKGRAAEVFPLLCPVREYEWLPGWKCEMAYAKSGVAEKDAIFHTREMHFSRVVWTLITFEPHSQVEYLMVAGRDAVVRLSVDLAERTPGSTEISWKMLFTATSVIGKRSLSAAFSEKKFQEMMRARETELNHFLQTGGMIGT